MCCDSPTGSGGGSRAGSAGPTSTATSNFSTTSSQLASSTNSGGVGTNSNVCSGGGGGMVGGSVATAAAGSGSSRGGVVRRSRSQGTRKLHKCLSTASYSEDSQAAANAASLISTTGSISTSSSPVLHPQARHHQLLVTRQYCSFGSTSHHMLFFVFSFVLGSFLVFISVRRNGFDIAIETLLYSKDSSERLDIKTIDVFFYFHVSFFVF